MGPPAERARNVRVISVTNLLAGTYNNLLQVVLQPFVVRLAGSVVTLSILQAFSNRLGGIVGALAQLAGGHLTDRWGRKPVMVLGSAFTMASLSLFLATAITGWWPLLVPAFGFLGLGLVRDPASQSTVAESVEVHGRAMAYSKALFFLIVPAAVMAFVGGVLADRFGYAVVFGLSLALEAANFALFALVLRETLRVRNAEAWSVRRAFRLREPAVKGLLIVTAADSFVWGISLMIVYGMAVTEFGFTNADIGLIVGVWALVFAGAALPVGKLVTRFGSRGMILISESLGLPIFAGWMLARTPTDFVLVSVLNGLTAAAWVPAWQTMISNAVPDTTRGIAIGQVTAFRGLLAFPAPLLGGLLYDELGYAAPLAASFAGVIVVMALIVRFLREPRPVLSPEN
jgi:MFS family permease